YPLCPGRHGGVRRGHHPLLVEHQHQTLNGFLAETTAPPVSIRDTGGVVNSAHRSICPRYREPMAKIQGLEELLTALNAGENIPGGSPHHAAMHAASQESLRITAELNGRYHSPEEVRSLMSE